MDLGFGKGAGDSEDHSLAVVAAHADGDEGGTIPDHTVDTDFVVGGVEGEVEDLGEGASTPFCELGIELFGEDGDLAGRDVETAEFLHDFSDSPSANAFDIHGGDGGFERPFAAASLLEKGGAEGRIAFTNLGDGELELAHGGLETARFETVGVAVAGLDVALVGRGSDVSDSLEKHGGVHEKFGDFGDGVFEAVLVDEIWMLDILYLFVDGLCCFWLAPSVSGRGRAPTTPKGRGRAAAEAGDSATLQRPLLRRAGASRTYRQRFTLPFALYFMIRFCGR